MRPDASIRHAVSEIAPAVRQLSDIELRAFVVALYGELARRDGGTVASEWAQAQADRLRNLDATTL